MSDLEKSILNDLLDKYENSKLSKGGTKVKKEIKLVRGEKTLSTYKARDSYNYTDNNDIAIKKLENAGFISAIFDGNDLFVELKLNIDRVDEIYAYVNRVNSKAILNEMENVLKNEKINENLDPFVQYLNQYIKEKCDFPKRYFSTVEELKLILNTFNGLFELEEETKERDFSVRYLKDSKLFSTIRNKVINIARDFLFDSEDDDETILFKLNIVKNSTYVFIKNKLVFKLGGEVISLDSFGYEFALSDQMIKDISILNSNIHKVITVENLTSFHSLADKDALIIYLAGYHNHTKQLLLKKIYKVYPEAEYYHFGDIDAGGFWIFEKLKYGTGINFKPYRMNKEMLFKNKENLKSLTRNDIQRLEKMANDSRFDIFKDVIQYMLENKVKLEQEILD